MHNPNEHRKQSNYDIKFGLISSNSIETANGDTSKSKQYNFQRDFEIVSVKANEVGKYTKKSIFQGIIFEELSETSFDEPIAGLDSGLLRCDIGVREMDPESDAGDAGEQAADGEGQLLRRGEWQHYNRGSNQIAICSVF